MRGSDSGLGRDLKKGHHVQVEELPGENGDPGRERKVHVAEPLAAAAFALCLLGLARKVGLPHQEPPQGQPHCHCHSERHVLAGVGDQVAARLAYGRCARPARQWATAHAAHNNAACAQAAKQVGSRTRKRVSFLTKT
eukprot:1166466-Rhodomonas_salina.2